MVEVEGTAPITASVRQGQIDEGELRPWMYLKKPIVPNPIKDDGVPGAIENRILGDYQG